MITVSLTPERYAELAQFAEKQGQTVETALDELLACHFVSNAENDEEIRRGIVAAIEQVEAGETTPAEEVYAWIREKHGL